IEDIYPLTPMQQGLLFHTLREPAQATTYVEQVHLMLDGRVDQEAMRATWQDLIDRHPALRTMVIWDRRDEPFQVVQHRVEVPWHQHDWAALPPVEQADRLAALLVQEKRRGFELGRAPLLRLHLIRLAPERHHLVFGFHHLIL